MYGLSRRAMLAATFGGAATLAASRYRSSQAAEEARHSDLWGKAGETWSPKSRLPDFSFAGYRAGQRPIPKVAVKASVKDFGARGDGNADAEWIESWPGQATQPPNLYEAQLARRSSGE